MSFRTRTAAISVAGTYNTMAFVVAAHTRLTVVVNGATWCAAAGCLGRKNVAIIAGSAFRVVRADAAGGVFKYAFAVVGVLIIIFAAVKLSTAFAVFKTVTGTQAAFRIDYIALFIGDFGLVAVFVHFAIVVAAAESVDGSAFAVRAFPADRTINALNIAEFCAVAVGGSGVIGQTVFIVVCAAVFFIDIAGIAENVACACTVGAGLACFGAVYVIAPRHSVCGAFFNGCVATFFAAGFICGAKGFFAVAIGFLSGAFAAFAGNFALSVKLIICAVSVAALKFKTGASFFVWSAVARRSGINISARTQRGCIADACISYHFAAGSRRLDRTVFIHGASLAAETLSTGKIAEPALAFVGCVAGVAHFGSGIVVLFARIVVSAA